MSRNTCGYKLLKLVCDSDGHVGMQVLECWQAEQNLSSEELMYAITEANHIARRAQSDARLVDDGAMGIQLKGANSDGNTERSREKVAEIAEKRIKATRLEAAASELTSIARTLRIEADVAERIGV